MIPALKKKIIRYVNFVSLHTHRTHEPIEFSNPRHTTSLTGFQFKLVEMEQLLSGSNIVALFMFFFLG